VQIFWAWEQHVEEIAAGLGIDSLTLRLRNVVGEGDRSVSDELLYKPAGRAVLQTLAGELEKQAPPPGAGRGISFVCRHTGGGKTSIKASLKPSGAIDVVIGAPDQGGGAFTVVRRIMAGILGIAPEMIAVRRGTTAEAALDPGTGASRVTHIVGQASIVAANALLAKLAERTSTMFENGVFVDTHGLRLSFAAIAAQACGSGSIDVVGAYDGSHEGDHPADYTFSCFAIDVSVDAETGAFEIVDTLFITDAGQIINPIGHQGQIDGGFVYGLGGALMEEMPTDESGKITTLSLGEYKLPTINDIPPPFRTVIVPSEGQGPYGAKMAGELSNSGVAPALMNAIHSAVGVRLSEFPITAERIYRALQSRRSDNDRSFA